MTRELILDIVGWIVIAGIVAALVFASPRIRQMEVTKKQEKAMKKAKAYGRRMSAIEEMEQNIERQVNEEPAASEKEI